MPLKDVYVALIILGVHVRSPHIQGHGVLHAIYASVDKACAEKGWPGVDLLIIGGDFQVIDLYSAYHATLV